jgi:hypothetical protein
MPSTILARTRWTRYVAAGLLLAYVIVVAQSSAIGLGDASNHLARAYIMADLIFHNGAVFGAQFQYHFQAVPYVLPDLLLTAAVEALGVRTALASFTVLTFLSVPAALLLYFRVTLGARGQALLEDEAALFLLLCAAYLSTDFFFVAGFFAFNLGLACAIVTLALIERLRRRWSNGLFALYGGLVVMAYLIHLSTLVFLATIVAISAFMRLRSRSSSLRHELILSAPLVVMVAWQFGVAEHYRRPSDLTGEAYRWGTLRDKILQIRIGNFHRYGGYPDPFLRYLYVASLLMLIRSRKWRYAFASPRVIELLALAAAFFGMYFALPFSYREASYIDIRALAPATLFILLACLHLPRAEPPAESSRSTPSLAVVFALVLSISNLLYLGEHFWKLFSWSTQYRAVFAAIPRGAHVLPVYTVPSIYKYMEPSPITVIDRQAWIPYLFSGNTGQPMTYFRYVDRPYTPADDWYMKGPLLVDWRQIACNYQYILVTRPFDLRRIRVATTPVAETSSAAVLAIDRRASDEPCGDTSS